MFRLLSSSKFKEAPGIEIHCLGDFISDFIPDFSYDFISE